MATESRDFAFFLFDSAFPVFMVGLGLRSIQEITSRNDTSFLSEATFLRISYTNLPITLARFRCVSVPEDTIKTGNRISKIVLGHHLDEIVDEK